MSYLSNPGGVGGLFPNLSDSLDKRRRRRAMKRKYLVCGHLEDTHGPDDCPAWERAVTARGVSPSGYVELRDAISEHIERAARETGTYHGDPTATPGGTGYCLPAAVATQIVDKYLLSAPSETGDER